MLSGVRTSRHDLLRGSGVVANDFTPLLTYIREMDAYVSNLQKEGRS